MAAEEQTLGAKNSMTAPTLSEALGERQRLLALLRSCEESLQAAEEAASAADKAILRAVGLRETAQIAAKDALERQRANDLDPVLSEVGDSREELVLAGSAGEIVTLSKSSDGAWAPSQAVLPGGTGCVQFDENGPVRCVFEDVRPEHDRLTERCSYVCHATADQPNSWVILIDRTLLVCKTEDGCRVVQNNSANTSIRLNPVGVKGGAVKLHIGSELETHLIIGEDGSFVEGGSRGVQLHLSSDSSQLACSTDGKQTNSPTLIWAVGDDNVLVFGSVFKNLLRRKTQKEGGEVADRSVVDGTQAAAVLSDDGPDPAADELSELEDQVSKAISGDDSDALVCALSGKTTAHVLEVLSSERVATKLDKPLGSGYTALICAVMLRKPAALRQLVETLKLHHSLDFLDKPDVNCGSTALSWAAYEAYPEAMAILIEAGADVCRCSTLTSTTPLLWACIANGDADGGRLRSACMRLLVDHGASTSALHIDKSGQTFHALAMRGSEAGDQRDEVESVVKRIACSLGPSPSTLFVDVNKGGLGPRQWSRLSFQVAGKITTDLLVGTSVNYVRLNGQSYDVEPHSTAGPGFAIQTNTASMTKRAICCSTMPSTLMWEQPSALPYAAGGGGGDDDDGSFHVSEPCRTEAWVNKGPAEASNKDFNKDDWNWKTLLTTEPLTSRSLESTSSVFFELHVACYERLRFGVASKTGAAVLLSLKSNSVWAEWDEQYQELTDVLASVAVDEGCSLLLGMLITQEMESGKMHVSFTQNGQPLGAGEILVPPTLFSVGSSDAESSSSSLPPSPPPLLLFPVVKSHGPCRVRLASLGAGADSYVKEQPPAPLLSSTTAPARPLLVHAEPSLESFNLQTEELPPTATVGAQGGLVGVGGKGFGAALLAPPGALPEGGLLHLERRQQSEGGGGGDTYHSSPVVKLSLLFGGSGATVAAKDLAAAHSIQLPLTMRLQHNIVAPPTAGDGDASDGSSAGGSCGDDINKYNNKRISDSCSDGGVRVMTRLSDVSEWQRLDPVFVSVHEKFADIRLQPGPLPSHVAIFPSDHHPGMGSKSIGEFNAGTKERPTKAANVGAATAAAAAAATAVFPAVLSSACVIAYQLQARALENSSSRVDALMLREVVVWVIPDRDDARHAVAQRMARRLPAGRWGVAGEALESLPCAHGGVVSVALEGCPEQGRPFKPSGGAVFTFSVPLPVASSSSSSSSSVAPSSRQFFASPYLRATVSASIATTLPSHGNRLRTSVCERDEVEFFVPRPPPPHNNSALFPASEEERGGSEEYKETEEQEQEKVVLNRILTQPPPAPAVLSRKANGGLLIRFGEQEGAASLSKLSTTRPSATALETTTSQQQLKPQLQLQEELLKSGALVLVVEVMRLSNRHLALPATANDGQVKQQENLTGGQLLPEQEQQQPGDQSNTQIRGSSRSSSLPPFSVCYRGSGPECVIENVFAAFVRCRIETNSDESISTTTSNSRSQNAKSRNSGSSRSGSARSAGSPWSPLLTVGPLSTGSGGEGMRDLAAAVAAKYEGGGGGGGGGEEDDHAEDAMVELQETADDDDDDDGDEMKRVREEEAKALAVCDKEEAEEAAAVALLSLTASMMEQVGAVLRECSRLALEVRDSDAPNCRLLVHRALATASKASSSSSSNTSAGHSAGHSANSSSNKSMSSGAARHLAAATLLGCALNVQRLVVAATSDGWLARLLWPLPGRADAFRAIDRGLFSSEGQSSSGGGNGGGGNGGTGGGGGGGGSGFGGGGLYDDVVEPSQGLLRRHVAEMLLNTHGGRAKKNKKETVAMVSTTASASASGGVLGGRGGGASEEECSSAAESSAALAAAAADEDLLTHSIASLFGVSAARVSTELDSIRFGQALHRLLRSAENPLNVVTHACLLRGTPGALSSSPYSFGNDPVQPPLSASFSSSASSPAARAVLDISVFVSFSRGDEAASASAHRLCRALTNLGAFYLDPKNVKFFSTSKRSSSSSSCGGGSRASTSFSRTMSNGSGGSSGGGGGRSSEENGVFRHTLVASIEEGKNEEIEEGGAQENGEVVRMVRLVPVLAFTAPPPSSSSSSSASSSSPSFPPTPNSRGRRGRTVAAAAASQTPSPQAVSAREVAAAGSQAAVEVAVASSSLPDESDHQTAPLTSSTATPTEKLHPPRRDRPPRRHQHHHVSRPTKSTQQPQSRHHRRTPTTPVSSKGPAYSASASSSSSSSSGGGGPRKSKRGGLKANKSGGGGLSHRISNCFAFVAVLDHSSSNPSKQASKAWMPPYGNSLTSPWSARELALADQALVPILPVLLPRKRQLSFSSPSSPSSAEPPSSLSPLSPPLNVLPSRPRPPNENSSSRPIPVPAQPPSSLAGLVTAHPVLDCSSWLEEQRAQRKLQRQLGTRSEKAAAAAVAAAAAAANGEGGGDGIVAVVGDASSSGEMGSCDDDSGDDGDDDDDEGIALAVVAALTGRRPHPSWQKMKKQRQQQQQQPLLSSLSPSSTSVEAATAAALGVAAGAGEGTRDGGGDGDDCDDEGTVLAAAATPGGSQPRPYVRKTKQRQKQHSHHHQQQQHRLQVRSPSLSSSSSSSPPSSFASTTTATTTSLSLSSPPSAASAAESEGREKAGIRGGGVVDIYSAEAVSSASGAAETGSVDAAAAAEVQAEEVAALMEQSGVDSGNGDEHDDPGNEIEEQQEIKEEQEEEDEVWEPAATTSSSFASSAGSATGSQDDEEVEQQEEEQEQEQEQDEEEEEEDSEVKEQEVKAWLAGHRLGHAWGALKDLGVQSLEDLALDVEDEDVGQLALRSKIEVRRFCRARRDLRISVMTIRTSSSLDETVAEAPPSSSSSTTSSLSPSPSLHSPPLTSPLSSTTPSGNPPPLVFSTNPRGPKASERLHSALIISNSHSLDRPTFAAGPNPPMLPTTPTPARMLARSARSASAPPTALDNASEELLTEEEKANNGRGELRLVTISSLERRQQTFGDGIATGSGEAGDSAAAASLSQTATPLLHTAPSPGGSLSPKPAWRCHVFGSMRFTAKGPARVPGGEAATLAQALASQGVKLHVIDVAAGASITYAVFKVMETCDAFLAFGSRDYGEETGNPAATDQEIAFWINAASQAAARSNDQSNATTKEAEAESTTPTLGPPSLSAVIGVVAVTNDLLAADTFSTATAPALLESTDANNTEAKAKAKKKPLIPLRMIPFTESFDHLPARLVFGTNALSLHWLLGDPMPPDLLSQLLRALDLEPL